MHQTGRWPGETLLTITAASRWLGPTSQSSLYDLLARSLSRFHSLCGCSANFCRFLTDMDKPAESRRGGLPFLANKQPPDLTRTPAATAFSCPVSSAAAPSWCLIYSKTLFGVSGWWDEESCYRRTEWLNVPLWCNRVEAKRKQGFRESKHTARNIWKAIWADWGERCLALGFSAAPAGVGPSGRLRFRHLRSLCLSPSTDDRKFCLVLSFTSLQLPGGRSL